jgi:HEPN domain-containing protein
MLTKEEHIKYWVETAKRDWQAIQKMYKSKVYLHALFFAHLVLEKLCKAHWVKDNVSNTPPKIHNLITLVDKTKLKLSEEDRNFLFNMNQFQLEGRYPDYKDEIFKKYKSLQTKKILDKVDILRKCLLKNL